MKVDSMVTQALGVQRYQESSDYLKLTLFDHVHTTHHTWRVQASEPSKLIHEMATISQKEFSKKKKIYATINHRSEILSRAFDILNIRDTLCRIIQIKNVPQHRATTNSIQTNKCFVIFLLYIFYVGCCIVPLQYKCYHTCLFFRPHFKDL